MLLSALALIAAIASAPVATDAPDPLSTAIAHFRAIDSYRVDITSTHTGGEEHVRYYYKKRGYVRMEFIHPHEGAVLLFNPNTGKVRLWPLGMGSFPELTLPPDSSIIRSYSGNRVDRSDIGTLYENMRLLRDQGSLAVLGEENRNGRMVVHFLVSGGEGQTVADVHSSEMWLDTSTQFPLKVISRDLHGDIIETVQLEELTVDEKLPEYLFNP